jgi:elongation factor G
MKDIPVSDVRNFILLGHSGSGKTTLVDALLHRLGINDRLGLVASGSSMADFTDEEKERKISVFSKSFSAPYKSSDGRTIEMMFCDTPGYVDFFGQVISASRATETGMIVIDAASGVQLGSRRSWRLCNRQELSKAIVISGLDKDNVDYATTLSDIKAAFGPGCVPVSLPKTDGSGFVDILGKDIPEDLADQVAEIKGSLVELAAETDDTLIEKFLGGEDLSPEEISHGLRDSVASGALVPVFACNSLKETGITELLDGLSRLFPSPVDRDPKDAEGNVIATGASDSMVGFVWRSVNDPFVGQLTFVRILGGTLKGDSEIVNANNGEKERVGSILQVNGKKQVQVESATAGDIVAIPKLKHTGVGDTLCSTGSKTVCASFKFPSPVMFQAVHAKTQADEDKLGTALHRVADEDPTLHVVRNNDTHEMVLQGLGDVHIGVAVNMMKSRSNVAVLLTTPKVPYKETVQGLGEGHYKHKKQSGGRGQFGEVYLKVEAKRPDEEDWFLNETVGGSIPSNFMPAVQKGLVEAMVAGPLAGCPVTNMKVHVYDGSYHDVDSSEVAFKIAGGRAFREAMLAAKPVLLEPIMTVKVAIPDSSLGDINSDLNQKRGRILGMETKDGMQVITADVPQAELFKYAAELRSMTAGEGTFSMEYSRYDVVPQNVAQKVIAEVAKEKEEAH